MKVKICGQTSIEDCAISLRCGADYVGVVVDVDWSDRSLSVDEAQPIFDAFRAVIFVLTFNMDGTDKLAEVASKLDPYALQLTGQESAEYVSRLKQRVGSLVYKSIHLAPEGEGKTDTAAVLETMEQYHTAGVDGFVLDTMVKGKFGGTGVKNDWEMAGEIASEAPGPLFLAGGINPDNVGSAIAVPGIYGVDLASGVESSKGVKSEAKIKALLGAMRSAKKART